MGGLWPNTAAIGQPHRGQAGCTEGQLRVWGAACPHHGEWRAEQNDQAQGSGGSSGWGHWLRPLGDTEGRGEPQPRRN